MLRRLKRIALWVCAGTMVLALALVVIARVYEEEVKAKLIAELNVHLRAPLHQNGIELTLIKRFPQASLRLRDVLMYEVRSDDLPADTLVHAEDLYLEFGLLTLLSGNYRIAEVHGKNVLINAGFDTRGAENWNVWKSDTTSTASATLDIRKVTLREARLRYHDHRDNTAIASNSDKLELRARFGDAKSELGVRGDMHLLHLRQGHKEQLADRKAVIDLDMLLGEPGVPFRISRGEVAVARSTLRLTLTINETPKGDQIDLRSQGFGLQLADVLALLPEELVKPLRHYGLQGKADVAITYAGPLQAPMLSAALSLSEGRLTETNSGTRFTDVRGGFSVDLSAEGHMHRLLVDDLYARSGSGTLNADLEVKGLTKANVKGAVRADLDLADLLRFIRLDTLEQVSGRLKADARVEGQLRDVRKVNANDLKQLTISGTASLRNAGLKLKGLRHRVEHLDADMALYGNDAEVKNLHGEFQGNRIELNGRLDNLLPYIFYPGQRLTISARGRSPRLDLATLLQEENANSKRDQNNYVFTLPAMVDLDVKATVDELLMEQFEARQVSATVRLRDRQLSVVPLSLNTAGGRVLGSLRLDGRGSGPYPLSIDAEINGIDVQRLFAQFKDFGQQFITQKHLRGTGDLSLTMTAALASDFSLVQDRLHCVADITLNNGRLIDHASLVAVADYLRTNKLITPFVETDRLKKQLRDVSFARLQNRIEIKDRQVFLPQMLVSSSVMDLEVSGVHGFDGQVDDHLNFRLGDLFRTASSGHDEFGPIIDDGTGLRIFLHMFGTTDDLRFAHDGAMAAAKRKAKRKQESEQLKNIVQGVFTGKPNTGKAPHQGRITVIDPDAEEAAPANTPAPRKGLGKLLERKKEEPKERVTIEFDD